MSDQTTDDYPSPSATGSPWKLWRLAPESDELQRLIIVTADGEDEICGPIHDPKHAAVLAAAPMLLDVVKRLAMAGMLSGTDSDVESNDPFEELLGHANEALNAYFLDDVRFSGQPIPPPVPAEECLRYIRRNQQIDPENDKI